MLPFFFERASFSKTKWKRGTQLEFMLKRTVDTKGERINFVLYSPFLRLFFLNKNAIKIAQKEKCVFYFNSIFLLFTYYKKRLEQQLSTRIHTKWVYFV